MKKIVSFLVATFILFACDTGKTTGKPETDADAASMFIRSALNGQWKEARKLILEDSANIEDLELSERLYTERTNANDQRSYRESQITVYNIRQINDSASVITYSNTFRNQRDSLKVVRVAGDWLVDLKYSFSPAKKTIQ